MSVFIYMCYELKLQMKKKRKFSEFDIRVDNQSVFEPSRGQFLEKKIKAR